MCVGTTPCYSLADHDLWVGRGRHPYFAGENTEAQRSSFRSCSELGLEPHGQLLAWPLINKALLKWKRQGDLIEGTWTAREGLQGLGFALPLPPRSPPGSCSASPFHASKASFWGHWGPTALVTPGVGIRAAGVRAGQRLYAADTLLHLLNLWLCEGGV